MGAIADLFCLFGSAICITPFLIFLHRQVKICFFLLTFTGIIFALECNSCICWSLGSYVFSLSPGITTKGHYVYFLEFDTDEPQDVKTIATHVCIFISCMIFM